MKGENSVEGGGMGRREWNVVGRYGRWWKGLKGGRGW